MNRDELLRIARDRLYPSLTNPNYLVLRARRVIFSDWMRNLPDGVDVLDVGGRYQPYRPLLQEKTKTYVALDVEPSELLSVRASGEHLPFADASFDLAIATQVFEYFEVPQQAAAELYRVLRPGGVLLMSTAFLAPRFVDEELWRYTAQGLRNLLAAFAQITVQPELSNLASVCRLKNLFLHDALILPALRKLYGFTICPVINLMGRAFEAAAFSRSDNWAGNYSVRAIK
ncbi:MAG: hypothetical protein DMG91_11885 [Acidobacteria bacterium]|jgi:SAM-dependent methyltransferase|nr:MAG: hypothetical protein DMG91_11885 [Acidobacteriota bacterium]